MGKELYAEVILPLAVRGSYTYRVPEMLKDKLEPGSRVVVNFGSRKLYSGIVFSLSDTAGDASSLKEISEVLDPYPVINAKQISFWRWISEYYMCTTGEVMRAAMPSGLCLESETRLSVNPIFSSFTSLGKESFMLFNIISNKQEISVKQLPAAIDEQSTIRLLNDLVKKNAIVSGETISESYKPKEERYVVLPRQYTDSELNAILDKLRLAPKQLEAMLSYLRITGYSAGSDLFPLAIKNLLKESGAPPSSVSTLIRKGFLVLLTLEASRLEKGPSETEPASSLSTAQEKAFSEIKNLMPVKDIVLLHGVTSSGKTEIYIRLINEYLDSGKQVLYLLPEIALTTQIISRLKKHFGRKVTVYHSRLSDPERIEVWKRVRNNEEDGFQLIIGARSALFLPYNNLGLVIVDEEHDSSYKQQDPAPRYHARDSAIMMASFWKAPVLLGSATPSIESMHNSVSGKYGYVWLGERYGNVNLPEIQIANTSEAYRKKLMVSHFSPQLLNAIDNALSAGEQVILFRNRRGFSPFLQCTECGWIPSCTQCAVNLSYHKDINRLVCHYCGNSYQVYSKCNSCGNFSMVTKGFGTEKIEDEIKIVFPKARVARIDQDTTRKKSSFERIISDFENNETDILIGTQMISKGLDFENLTVVGILHAEAMLSYPDFRAHEKAFQMMAQVSGRAGRRSKHGRVIIQTGDPSNPVIRQVINNDFTGMYNMQLEERKTFGYPPFSRLVKISVKHKDRSKLNEFSDILGADLRKAFGTRVLGPEFPVISRIQLWYIKSILIKIEKERSFSKAKLLISECTDRVLKQKGAGSLRINIDVDPY
ncbi:MAG: primosomal protein N' [Bacteroidales bacterium]